MAYTERDVYQELTDKMLKEMEGGKIPWEQPWLNTDHTYQATNQPATGINMLLLSMHASMHEYESSKWITFKQAKDQGLSLKGATGKSCNIMRVETIKHKKELDELDDDGNKKIHVSEFKIAKWYQVFNMQETQGYDLQKEKDELRLNLKAFNKIEECEIALKAITEKTDLKIKEILGSNQAFYQRAADLVVLPDRHKFKDEIHFWSTTFHEIGHATMHPKRMERAVWKASDIGLSMGGKERALEELTVDLASFFINSKLGLQHSQEHIREHAAYHQSWMSILKDDKSAFVKATTEAQKICNYVMGVVEEYKQEMYGNKIDAAKVENSIGKDRQAALTVIQPDKQSHASKQSHVSM